MTSYGLQSKIQVFLQNQDSAYLQAVLREIAEMFVTFTEATYTFYSNRGDLEKAEEIISPIISDINLRLKKLSPKKIFIQVDSLNQSIKNLDFPRILLFFYDRSNNPDPLINVSSNLDTIRYSSSEFYNLTNRFESSYEEFIEAPNVSNIFSLLRHGHALYLITLNTKLMLEDILDKLSENQPPTLEDFFPFGNTPPNNNPFNDAEQKEVAEKLDLIETQLIKAASQNAESNEDLKNSLETNINEIRNGIQELKTSSVEMGRKDWLLQFYSVYFNLVMCICFSNEARTTLFSVIQSLSFFVKAHAPHLLN